MHAITKLKWKWRDGNTASNEHRKSKGTFGVTSCHYHADWLGWHTAHVNTSWQMNMTTLTGYTAHVNTSWAYVHDNTNWVHTLHVSTTPGHTAHVNTSWAYE
jgi:hypothetical protein